MKFNTALVIICSASRTSVCSTFAFAPGTNTKKMPNQVQGGRGSASASASSSSFVAVAGSPLLVTASNTNRMHRAARPTSPISDSALYSSADDIPSDMNVLEDQEEEQEIVDGIVNTMLDELELPAGARPIIQARNDLISTSNALTSESPTGLFITRPSDRAQFTKAVARLEAIAPTTSDESEPLMLGEWTLVATSRKTVFDVNNSSSAGNSNGKKKISLPKLNPKIKNSIKVTQSIRTDQDESLKTINRIDNIIEFDNTMTKLLPAFLNPLQIDQSKVILVHKAKVQTFVPFRTKLALQSVVLNIAGQTKNLDPNGADVFGLNIPSLSEWMNSGEFDTTYVDQDVRVSRGTIGFLEQTRVFVRKGSHLLDSSVMDNEVYVETPEEKQLNSIVEAIGGVADAVGELTNDVKTTVEKDLGYMRDDVEVTMQEIKDVVEDDVKEIGDAVSKVKSAIIGDEEVEEAIDNAVSAVTDFERDVEESIHGAADSLKKTVDEDMEKVQGAVKEVTDAALKEDIEEAEGEEQMQEDVSADVTSDDITVGTDADADDDLKNAKDSKKKKNTNKKKGNK